MTRSVQYYLKYPCGGYNISDYMYNLWYFASIFMYSLEINNYCLNCRCLTLVDMVKTAHRNHIWDIAFVACQMCLYYDDGRWKGVLYSFTLIYNEHANITKYEWVD